MRVYLVRHGQTSWNISGRAQGHTDIPLDPTGQQQAKLLGQSFEGTHVDQIFSSDLSRAKETAESIAKAVNTPIEVRHDLRERSFGNWEGLDFGSVANLIQEQANSNSISNQLVRPPAGESFADVWERLDPIHAHLQTAEGTVVIVSHGGTLALLAAKLIRGTLDTCRAFRLSNTGITVMDRRDEGLFLITQYNDTSHLASLDDEATH